MLARHVHVLGSMPSKPIVTTGALLVAAAAAAAATLVSLWRRARKAEAEMARVTEAGVNLPIMPLLPISSKQTTGFCRSLQLLDSDVFICSYPKSGTTWMQVIRTRMTVYRFDVLLVLHCLDRISWSLF